MKPDPKVPVGAHAAVAVDAVDHKKEQTNREILLATIPSSWTVPARNDPVEASVNAMIRNRIPTTVQALTASLNPRK